MSEILTYFQEINAQKQIDKLSKKFRNKKIVLYGAGEYCKILKDNYDLSALNIVGICDKKFETFKEDDYFDYKLLAPNDLKIFDFDVILVSILDDASTINYLEYKLLKKSPNKNKPVYSIVEPTFKYIVKTFLGI